MKAERTIIPALFAATLYFCACSSSTPQSTVPVAGSGSIKLQRSGAGFKQAENDRVKVSEASLQAVNFDGNYYVRWTFAIQPRQASELSSLRIEDVTGPASMVLVNNVAPQLENGFWRENAGLMDVSSPAITWLADPKESVRIFKFTIGEPGGQSYVLYQGVVQSPATKEAIRRMVSR